MKGEPNWVQGLPGKSLSSERDEQRGRHTVVVGDHAVDGGDAKVGQEVGGAVDVVLVVLQQLLDDARIDQSIESAREEVDLVVGDVPGTDHERIMSTTRRAGRGSASAVRGVVDEVKPLKSESAVPEHLQVDQVRLRHAGGEGDANLTDSAPVTGPGSGEGKKGARLGTHGPPATTPTPVMPAL